MPDATKPGRARNCDNSMAKPECGTAHLESADGNPNSRARETSACSGGMTFGMGARLDHPAGPGTDVTRSGDLWEESISAGDFLLAHGDSTS
jgi:hypothetical protein